MDTVQHAAAQSGSTVPPHSVGPDPAERPRVVSAEERCQMIAVAAYRRYESRGGAPGDALADWLDAEKEVDGQLEGRSAGPAGEREKSVFVQTLSGALAECQSQLDELRQKAVAANAAIRRKYQKQLAMAADKHGEALARLKEVREHTGGAWGHLKEGAERATGEMRQALREAASLFK